jgi:hypothetical protein
VHLFTDFCCQLIQFFAYFQDSNFSGNSLQNDDPIKWLDIDGLRAAYGLTVLDKVSSSQHF